jgi:hypothetical protein
VDARKQNDAATDERERIEALRSDDIYWTFKARELMQQRKSFVVEKWSQQFDEVEARPLVRQFGYTIEYRNKDMTQAFFSPDAS